MESKRLAGVCLSLLLCFALAAPLHAGAKDIEWEFSGQYRIRPEGRWDHDLDKGSDDQRTPFLQRVRFAVGVKPNDKVKVFLQFQDSRAWGDEASTASNEANLDLHQGYLRLIPNKSFNLTVGRQKWNYGDQRLIGGFEWNNVGRAFDGVRAHGKLGAGWIDGFWGRLARFLEGDEANQDLFGAYGHFDLADGMAVEPYFLAFREGIERPGEIEDTAGKSHVLAFGGRFAGKWGPSKLSAEVVGQTGEVGGDDLSAWAFAAMFKHRLGEDSLWFMPQAGFDYASGDEDPTDGERGEFFNFFPTNHLHYGYIDFFGWRNIVSPWFGVGVGNQRHSFLFKYHGFWLAQEAGRWSSAGGATLGFDPEGLSGDQVGYEFDLSYKVKVFEIVQLHAGWAIFTPQEYAKNTRGEDTANFLYFETTVNF